MNRLTALFVQRPALATVLVLITVLAGLLSYPGLVQQQFPNVDLPVMQIVALYPGASPNTIRDTIVRPIEDQLAGAPDLDHIQTTIQQGGATVSAFFSLASDKTADLSEVQRRLQSAEAYLPTDLKAPSINTYDPSQGTVVELAVSTTRVDPHDLSNLVDNTIVPQMEQLSGVSFVQTSGDVTPSIEVAVDPDRLRAQGGTLNDVINAVANNNVRAPGGIATAHGRETTLDVRGDIQTPASVGNLLLGSAAAAPQQLNAWSSAPRALQIRDVAAVSYGYETQRVFAYHRGSPAIILDVRKASGASEVSVSDAVLKALPSFRTRFPDLDFAVVNVQADYTKEQIGEVWRALIEAIALTALVMLFFLRSWRNAVVVCVAIPTSLFVALTAMRVLHFTLDTVSLAAMTLVIGILVDDSTVVLENIERHRDAGEPAKNAAIAGRGEIALAAITLTLVDVVVFLPLAFLPGTVGRFMKEFGFVVTIATLTSLAISFTVTPAMAGCWSMFSTWKPGRIVDRFTAIFQRLGTAYATRVLPWALNHPRLVASISAASFVVALLLIPLGLVGFEFLPAVDNGEVAVQVSYPVGTALATTRDAILALEREIDSMPQVKGETAIAGSYQAEFGGFVQEGFVGQVHAFLRVGKGASTADWLATLLPRAHKLLPGASITAIPSTGITGGTQQPINYVVSAPPAKLDAVARSVYAAMRQTPGTANVTDSALEPMPNVDVEFNRDAARATGVDIGTAANALRAAFGGVIATQYSSPYGSQDVQVVYPFDSRDSLRALASIPIRSTNQGLVYAGDIARFVSRPSDPLITRLNRQDIVFVGSNVQPGYQLSRVTGAFRKRLGALPAGASLSPAPNGSQQNLLDTVSGIAVALVLSFVLVYLLMVALYDSFKTPFVMMFAIPVTAFGALGSLAVTHLTLNLFSMIGTLLLVALVTKNGILLVDFANRLRESGLSTIEAIAQSAATRFRPIVMTTFSMVVAMLPIALALEPGSEVRQALGVVVVGGLFSSLGLTLLLVPVVYVAMSGEHRRTPTHRKDPSLKIAASVATALLLAAIALPALAETLTPSKLLENPAAYEGKSVTVAGTVSHLQVSKTLFRKVTGFQLCDEKCIVVIDQTNAARHDGESATVSGTFQESFKGPKRTFKNVVLIR
ncbi:MAG TPA: efflux RND transporter permease subunit [Candidatus Baltobacteraceae bacterium]|nr:efflux RND transporter permease subunit [Candidatus Baltobacteraceae bacterium]